MHLARLVLLALAGGLLCGQAVLAQEPAPSPSPKLCDPAVTVCWTVERMVLGIRVWTQGAEPRNLAGGRGQVEVRYRRWRIQGQADGTATAAQYRSEDLSSVQDVEARGAVVWDALRLPGGISVGPMAGAALAFTLPRDGTLPTLQRSYTAVLGLAGSWPGGRIHAGVGPVHPFDRGVGFVCTWQLPASKTIANVGMFTYGRRTVPDAVDAAGVLVPAHSEASPLVWTAVAVRF